MYKVYSKFELIVWHADLYIPLLEVGKRVEWDC